MTRAFLMIGPTLAILGGAFGNTVIERSNTSDLINATAAVAEECTCDQKIGLLPPA